MADAKLGEPQALLSSLNSSHCQVLNAANPEALKGVLTGEGELPMKSDCDEQLLITLPFMSSVKLHSLLINSSEGAPMTIKLFANRVSMTFDDVESYPPTQVIELTASSFKEGSVAIPLHFVKFQSVQTLTVFIMDNLEGSEVTTISRLQVFGFPIHVTNVNDIKKQG